MEITFDQAKRDATLQERGMDFADAGQVFAGVTLDLIDDRFDYQEQRWITAGLLNGRMVVLVWTPTAEGRRIISMRKANDREQKRWADRLDRS